MRNPFSVILYNKSFARTGWVNDFAAIEVTPRHMLVGTAKITVASNHRQIPNLLAKGARVVITYRDEFLMSGNITNRSGVGPTSSGEITCEVQDDLWLYTRMLGWPVPGSAINAQGTKEDTRTGPAETVAKGFVSAQLAHNAVEQIQVATDQARGSTITVASRMKVLADQLLDVVDKAGIGLSAKQVGTKIVLDAYVPTVYPHTLSEEAGIITGWTWSDADPTATRVIVGGPNEGTSREFHQRINTAAEAELGYTVESFVDAQSAETSAGIDAAGDAALAEGARKSGFSLSLSESANFTYGPGGVRVGDRVTVDIGGQIFTDVLREATLSFTPDEGPKVVPTVGERTDDPDRALSKFLAAMAKSLRASQTR